MGEQQDVTVVLNGTQHEGTLVNGFVHIGRRKTTYGTAVSNTGKSIQENIWAELDDVMDLMMESGPPSKWCPTEYSDDLGIAAEWQQYGKWQGIAEALCLVICWFENPLHPDIDSVKGEAVLRYKRRQEATQEEATQEEAPNAINEEDADSSSSGSESVDATV